MIFLSYVFQRRSCGMHKCLNTCCIDVDHICDRICGKNLTCKKHKCTEPCHTGNCAPCLEASKLTHNILV